MPPKNPTGAGPKFPDQAPHVEYNEFSGGGGGAVTPKPGEPHQCTVHVAPGAHGRSFSMDTEDIVAVGAVMLCIGGVLAAVIAAIGLVLGRVQGSDAAKIILGCVGGSTIAAIISKAAQKKKGK